MATGCTGSGQGGGGTGGGGPPSRPTSSNNNNNDAGNSASGLMKMIVTIEEELESILKLSEWRAGQEACLLQNLSVVQRERQQIDLRLQNLRQQRQQYHQEFCRRFCTNAVVGQVQQQHGQVRGNNRAWNEVAGSGASAATSPQITSHEQRRVSQGSGPNADNVNQDAPAGRDESISSFVRSEPWQLKE